MSAAWAESWQFLAHPAYDGFERSVLERLTRLDHFPEPSELRALAADISNASPPWFDFAPAGSAVFSEEESYDRAIARTSRIPTRQHNFHDLLGALVWLHFPELKTAIHRVHLNQPGLSRSAAQNAATHLDESGVLVLSRDAALLDTLVRLNFRELFEQRREELQQHMQFLGFGHGLLDTLRTPHPRVMGKAWLVLVRSELLAQSVSERRVALDRALARRLPEFLSQPAHLMPLPVLGIPGWSARQSAEFYADASYFRSARSRPRAATGRAWLEL